jgi:hypothetical protein
MDPENDGVSIWVFNRGKKRPIPLTLSLKTIPNFDSNLSYVVIQQQSEMTYLNGQPFNNYTLFYWVGSRCSEYERNY